jgi:hypothetical protein
MTGIQIRDLVDVSALLGDEVFPVDTSGRTTKKAEIRKVADYTISLHKGEPIPHPNVRASSRVVTANLTAGQTGFYSVPLAKSFKLLRIEVSSPCRTRIYSSPAARASDASRPPLTDQDPSPVGIGLIAEVNLIGQLSIDLDNLTGSSMESEPSENFAIAVTNNSSAQTAITLTLHYLKLED